MKSSTLISFLPFSPARLCILVPVLAAVVSAANRVFRGCTFGRFRLGSSYRSSPPSSFSLDPFPICLLRVD
ncbi:hypothetical protein QBC40DRAFT_285499 [Triangularia verruculosa]|uniref:Uncharacterized protein n=1 Tax=Triangularia verruculosa TaxID=2587418 RepID=A0AAN7AQI7_9PEZI|nr:hypothetical protein QBC40DRAFT_285499 [Triangularia verruculosa]